MHNLLVNLLGVTNESGFFVMSGFLDWLSQPDPASSFRFIVLARREQHRFRDRLEARVDWILAPSATARWPFRWCWEFWRLDAVARRCHASCYLTPSGTLSPGLRIPQIVVAMNPWPLVREARGRRDAPKAWLQRLAYRRASREAEAMAFLSEYVREAYARNAGCPARLEAVVHPALATDVRKPVEAGRRKAGQIVCASAMARHKNVEAVIRALHTLRDIPGLRLVLVGGWPEPAYERDVRSLVRSLGLSEHVCFLGHVPRATLLACYAESAVFCLMSRCESFGIPAVEAQAFGTPVVGSDAGAIPEVCGRGGVYCAPDDISSIAAALRRLLVDNEEWQHRSDAARENAAGYTADRSAASFRTLLAAMLEGASRRPPGGPR